MRNRCCPNWVGRRRAASPLAPHRHDHTRFAAALARTAGSPILAANRQLLPACHANRAPKSANASSILKKCYTVGHERGRPHRPLRPSRTCAGPKLGKPPQFRRGPRATGIDAARTCDRKGQAGRYSSMTVADPRTSPTLLRGKSIRRECNGERGPRRLASCWSLVHPCCRAERRPSPRASVPPGGLRDPAPPLVSRST